MPLPSSSTLLPVALSPSSLSSYLLIVIIIVIVACRAVDRRAIAIVVLVVASRHRCRRCIMSRHCPPRRCHCHRCPPRHCHHRLRINTMTPHFSLGIPRLVWGSPNQNGDPLTEMGMQIKKKPQTDSGIPKPKWGSIHHHIKTGFPKLVWGLFSH
jgi:hypothetical protein